MVPGFGARLNVVITVSPEVKITEREDEPKSGATAETVTVVGGKF
ncbi:hypothetical protein ABEW81_26790 [Priestia megaterium]